MKIARLSVAWLRAFDQPSHRYTMRQAIEEGFILDVLKYYATYATYFRLLKSSEEDRTLSERRPLVRLPGS